MAVTVIREGAGFESAVLVQRNDEYFVVSSIAFAFDTGGPETLVFPADETGEITDWGEVAGGRGMSREEAIAQLDRALEDD